MSGHLTFSHTSLLYQLKEENKSLLETVGEAGDMMCERQSNTRCGVHQHCSHPPAPHVFLSAQPLAAASVRFDFPSCVN